MLVLEWGGAPFRFCANHRCARRPHAHRRVERPCNVRRLDQAITDIHVFHRISCINVTLGAHVGSVQLPITTLFVQKLPSKHCVSRRSTCSYPRRTVRNNLSVWMTATTPQQQQIIQSSKGPSAKRSWWRKERRRQRRPLGRTRSSLTKKNRSSRNSQPGLLPKSEQLLSFYIPPIAPVVKIPTFLYFEPAATTSQARD